MYFIRNFTAIGYEDRPICERKAPHFTQRQRDYSTRNHGIGVATPQYWINGRQTVLGADLSRVS
jgi:hypothetical protein